MRPTYCPGTTNSVTTTNKSLQDNSLLADTSERHFYGDHLLYKGKLFRHQNGGINSCNNNMPIPSLPDVPPVQG